MKPNCNFFFPQRQELWAIRVEMQRLPGALGGNLVTSSLYGWVHQGAGNTASWASELADVLRAPSGCPRVWSAGLLGFRGTGRPVLSCTVWPPCMTTGNPRIPELRGSFSLTHPVLTGGNKGGLMKWMPFLGSHKEIRSISEVFHRLRKGKPRMTSTAPQYSVPHRSGCLPFSHTSVKLIFGIIFYHYLILSILNLVITFNSIS